MSGDPKPSGELMKYLPSIFHEDKFLAEYLAPFEKILVGSEGTRPRSLEAIIAGIAGYFDPGVTPEEFLPWLSEWVALALRADLPVKIQRDFLAQVVSLYKLRGTAESLKRLLKTFTAGEATILEGDDLADTQNKDWNVTDGYQKWANGKPEHAFGVLLSFMSVDGVADKSAPAIKRKLAIAHALIDLEKPAHTIVYLVAVFPSMKLPVFTSTDSSQARRDKKVGADARSRLGYDTLLGVRRETPGEPGDKRGT
jgi:phage tail-like protein